MWSSQAMQYKQYKVDSTELNCTGQISSTPPGPETLYACKGYGRPFRVCQSYTECGKLIGHSCRTRQKTNV